MCNRYQCHIARKQNNSRLPFSLGPQASLASTSFGPADGLNNRF